MSSGGSRSAPGSTSSQPPVAGPPEGDLSPFDALEARLAALKDKMARGLPSRADELDDGARRLEQGDAAARDDVRRLAHKLRGIAGSYGFPRLGELAAELETVARGDALGSDVVARARDLARAARAAGPSGIVAEEASATRSLRDETAAPSVEAPSAPSAARPRAAMPAPAPELEGLVVLAADDDDATRRLLEITLVQLGRMTGALFDRGPLLLDELAARERVDLVVVDAMMPEMNGLELLEAVVARGLHDRVARFVVLSAASPEELGWALPPGLEVGWLRKPFRPRDLLTSLTALVSRSPAA